MFMGAEASAGAAASALGSSAQAEAASIMLMAIAMDLTFMVVSYVFFEVGLQDTPARLNNVSSFFGEQFPADLR
jgi:hypothetical protein